jgi:hypothetical protein
MFSNRHRYQIKKTNDIPSSYQNIQQKGMILLEWWIELYRIVIGTCLLWFIPPTNPTNNYSIHYFQEDSKCFYNIVVYMNMYTFFSFFILYIIEIHRENTLVTFLEVNPSLPTDNESVGMVVDNLNPIKKKKMYYIDTVYVSYAGYCMACFTVNTVLSGIVLFHNIDITSITGFITNILFMMTKIYQIVFVIRTEKHIFYSAYLINFVQFNDLDPEEKKWNEQINMNLNDVYIEDMNQEIV